jgi:addiction module HigA family antidote
VAIRSFKHGWPKALLERRQARGFPPNLANAARRRIVALADADNLNDLQVLRGHRLEALKGDRKGQFSIRINDQWRICFRWATELPKMSRSSTTTDEVVEGVKLPPIHPGEFLREDFLVPLKMSTEELGKACGVPRESLEALVQEKALLTGEIALRLARYFGNSPEFWMNVQARYEIEKAEDEFEAEIAQITPRSLAAAE